MRKPTKQPKKEEHVHERDLPPGGLEGEERGPPGVASTVAAGLRHAADWINDRLQQLGDALKP